MLAIAIVYTPRFARIARASALGIKTSEYLDAARLAGVSTPVILVRHVLPNVLPPVIVLAALSMSTAQLAYASLDFLGLGISPPQADWGSMLSKARDFITVAPWLVVFPTARAGAADAGLQRAGRCHPRRARSTTRRRHRQTRRHRLSRANLSRMAMIPVVLHPRLPPGVADFLQGVPGLVLHRPDDDDGVARALQQGAQVLATYTWRDDFLTPSLRWIAGAGVGVEQYPLARLAEQGVVLTTAAGVHAECVAEHAFALLLALTRRIGEAARNMTQARWVALPGEELARQEARHHRHGSHRRGHRAPRASPGACRSGRRQAQPGRLPRLPDRRARYRADAEVCDWADIVVLCAPATPDRSALIGARELARWARAGSSTSAAAA